MGSVKDDTIAEITKCVNVPKSSIQIAERLRKFILMTNAPPFNRLKKVGLWKFARIRENADGQVMLIIGTYGPISEELQAKIIDEFKDIKSLYYAETSETESFGTNYALHHLNGAEKIDEIVCGIIYSVFPTTQFPKSISTFQKIIRQIELFGALNKKTTLLDIDSGDGIYSFSLSRCANKVIAFESNPQLVERFKSIKEFNQINNVEIHNGEFEEIFPKMRKPSNSRIVAIVHPPHCGIRKKALLSLQKIPNLNTIIFISTNAEHIAKDIDEIFLDSNNNGNHFYVDSYIAVDSMPHTDRATVIISIK